MCGDEITWFCVVSILSTKRLKEENPRYTAKPQTTGARNFNEFLEIGKLDAHAFEEGWPVGTELR